MNSPGPTTVRLRRDEMSPSGGCLAKLPPLSLHDLLAGAWPTALGPGAPPHLMDRPEDCAVLPPNGEQLLVTTDLGPLVGTDLRRAGRIAALHALSDVYASGGVPHSALVTLVVCRDQPLAYAEAVLVGVLQACAEEGVQVVGGHTMTGREALAGMTVLGKPRAGTVLRKSGARPGDILLLSRPLGTGLVVRAYRLGVVGDAEMESALAVMETSNGPASALAVETGARAATDVTGFGLLGHLAEMLGPELGAVLDLEAVPVLEAARPLLDSGYRTIWTDGNQDYVRGRHRLTGVTAPARLLALLDPQTNGGLLVAAGPEAVPSLAAGGFVVIGRVTERPEIEIAGPREDLA